MTHAYEQWKCSKDHAFNSIQQLSIRSNALMSQACQEWGGEGDGWEWASVCRQTVLSIVISFVSSTVSPVSRIMVSECPLINKSLHHLPLILAVARRMKMSSFLMWSVPSSLIVTLCKSCFYIWPFFKMLKQATAVCFNWKLDLS